MAEEGLLSVPRLNVCVHVYMCVRVCTCVYVCVRVCNMVPNFIQNGIKMVSVGPSGPKLYEVGSKLAPC